MVNVEAGIIPHMSDAGARALEHEEVGTENDEGTIHPPNKRFTKKK